MYIVLADRSDSENKDQAVTKSTKAIGIGSNETDENFYVTFDGTMKATGADVQGTIYANVG
ncbi:MAG: hypothetical protein NC548_25660 [Lachnospiraceae bacterium]|nr:hypothetical protein [Lachnospiraceae bacterium]